MQAVHELGHVVGASLTGGTVERIVLHPLAISRTDVSPNPHPGVVVWLGPILGCIIPLGSVVVARWMPKPARNMAMFFAGFCLVANGAYIAIGSFDQVGDCREMLATGSPHWALLAFGAVTIPTGLLMWHRIGSIGSFVKQPEIITARLAFVTLIIAASIVLIELGLS